MLQSFISLATVGGSLNEKKVMSHKLKKEWDDNGGKNVWLLCAWC